MANKKTSELTTATTLSGSELVAIVQGGLSKKTTLSELPVSTAQAAADVLVLASATGYTDAKVEGLQYKNPVDVATTANITLSGTQTIDGIAVTSGMRVLVKDQTTASQNGIYIVASGAWSRSPDMNVDAEIPLARTEVKSGTANASKIFKCTNTTVTIGTTNITFVEVAVSGVLTSFNGRTASNAVPTAGDYDAFYYTKVQSDSKYVPYSGANSNLDLGTYSYFSGVPNTYVANRYIEFQGDSYTTGFGLSSVSLRFSTLVSKRLNYIESNLAVNGRVMQKQTPFNANNMVDNVSTISTYGATSGFLVIALGLNDAYNSNAGTYSSTNYTSDFTIVLNHAITTKGWPASKILIVSPYYVTTYGTGYYGTTSNSTIHMQYVAAAAALATSFGTLYYDAYNDVKNNGADLFMNGSDILHESDDAHAFIATGIERILTYAITKNSQRIAIGGAAEFDNIYYRNLSSSLPVSELGLSAEGLLVVDKIGHIRNNSTGVPQAANLDIRGFGKFGGAITSGGAGTFAGLLSIGGAASIIGAYPSNKYGLMFAGAGGNGYIDSYTAVANTAAPLSINTFSHGAVTIGGDTTINYTLTVVDLIKGNNALNIAGSYPSAGNRINLLMACSGGNGFIDAYTTTPNTAAPLQINNQGHGNIILGGPVTLFNSLTGDFINSTNYFNVKSGVASLPGSKTGTYFLSQTANSHIDSYHGTTSNLAIPLNINTFSGGDINLGGNLSLLVAGLGLKIKEGSNATMGTGSLVAGVATINTNKITANSRVFVVRSLAAGTLGDIGEDSSSRVVGTSFTVKSMTLGVAATVSTLDTSSFVWIIVESL